MGVEYGRGWSMAGGGVRPGVEYGRVPGGGARGRGARPSGATHPNSCSPKILQADGGTLAAAVNAAALALAHAGVPVRALVAAVGVTRLDETCLLDPSHAEVSGDGPEVVVACQATAPGAPGAGALVSLQADGAATVDEVADMVALGQEGCVAVVGVLRAALLEAAGVDAAARGPAA